MSSFPRWFEIDDEEAIKELNSLLAKEYQSKVVRISVEESKSLLPTVYDECPRKFKMGEKEDD